MFNSNYITPRDIVAVAAARLAGRDCEVSTHKRGNIYVMDSAVRYYNAYGVWNCCELDAAHNVLPHLHVDEILTMRDVISENFILRDYRIKTRIRSQRDFDAAVQKCINDIKKVCADALGKVMEVA